MPDNISLDDLIEQNAVPNDESMTGVESDFITAGQAQPDTVVVHEVEESKPDEEPDALHILEPMHEPANVTLVNGKAVTYVQKPLSYFGKMEFMGLLGRTIDQAMKGDDGLRVSDFFGNENSANLADLDSFLALIAKIANYAPDFLLECYLIWLKVPKGERAWAREALESIDDQQGVEIIERFIDQNWDALETFLTETVMRVRQRVVDRRS